MILAAGKARYLAAVLIAAIFFGCDRPLQSMNSIQIEIDLFSGRPNPGWTLTDAEATELRDLLARASVTSFTPMQEGLGYRGFLIHGMGSGGMAGHVRVFQGLILREGSHADQAWRDEAGAESWLHRLAVVRGYGDLLADEESPTTHGDQRTR